MAVKTKKTKKMEADLNQAAAELIRMAKEGGVEQNFFFVTTFERYTTQLNTLDELKKIIDSSDTMVEKEYVKGRPNLSVHPAIDAYNKTSTAANQTAATLLKLIMAFASGPMMNDGGLRDDDIDL